MILVVCEPEDTCGLWLVTEIARRGILAEHVLPEELVIGSRLTIRVTTHQDEASIHLGDGRHFDGTSLVGVINRMQRFPQPALISVSDRDLVYANEEVRAAVVAWFAGLPCPVLNSPSPYSAYGLMVQESHWRLKADQLGMGVAALKLESDTPVSQTTNYTVVVIGNSILAAGGQAVPTSIAEASKILSHSMGIRLTALDFHINSSGQWEFLRPNLLPDIIAIGQPAIDALLDEMRAS